MSIGSIDGRGNGVPPTGATVLVVVVGGLVVVVDVVDAGKAVVVVVDVGVFDAGAAVVVVIVVGTGGGSTLNPTDPRSVNSFPQNAGLNPTQAHTTYPPAATPGTANVPANPPLALTPHNPTTFVLFGGGTVEVVRWMLQEMLPPVGVKPNPPTVTNWPGTPAAGFTLIGPMAAAGPVGRLITAASKAVAMKMEKLRWL